jgi:hypothetical protein
MEFIKIPEYNLYVASSGERQGRIIIFRSDADEKDNWERIPETQIIIVGKEAKKELHRFVKNHGRPAANDLIPGGIAGRAYPALKKALGLAG